VQAARASFVTAYFVEQRKEAEGRDGWVSSSLVTCLKDKHQKVTRLKAKKTFFKMHNAKIQKNFFLTSS